MKTSFVNITVITAALFLLLLFAPARKPAASESAHPPTAGIAPVTAVMGVSAAQKETINKYQQMIFFADIIVVIYSVYRYGYNR